ncbi:hypothetical protein IMG5_007620, partial [Ichthyophthirius multifiliis]
ADRTQEINTPLSQQILIEVKKFCELHNWDENSMTFQLPLQSTNIKNHISDKSFDFLKDKLVLEEDKNQISKMSKNLAELVNAADYLVFKKLYTTLVVVLLTPLHVEPTQQGIDQFFQKWGYQQEDIDGDNLTQVVEENQNLFEKIVEVYKQDIDIIEQFQGVTDDWYLS